MKNQFTSILLILSVIAIVLSGCGNLSSGTAGKDISDSSDNQESDKVEIEVYHCTFNIASCDSTEVQAIENAINDYIADKIDVKIKLTDLGQGEYEDKCNLAIANGEANLFWTASWMEALSTDNLVSRKAVYDLSELIAGTDLQASIPTEVWDSSRYDGKDYFIPCYKESPEGYDLVYPVEKASKYGWDLSGVRKLSDIEPMLEQMKQDGVKYPLLTQMMPVFSKLYLDEYEFILGSTLIAVDRDTNEVIDCLTLPEYKEFLHLMSRWGEKDYISDEEATKTIPENTISTTDWGFALWWDVPVNEVASLNYGQECDVIHMTKNYLNSSSTLGSCFGVSSASTEEQAKACVDFMELMYTDPTLAGLFTFGIEGTDYDLENGFVVKKGGLYDHSSWESGSIATVPLEAGEPENKVELYETFNKKSEEALANGFRFDFSTVEAEWVACNSIYDQYGYVLEQGGYAEKEVEDIFEKYRSELDAAGYQKVLAETIKQYDAWKASK
ncbi:ABC transporter substrate-binding protein [Butyrivibrio sp. INlla14]|uniref:ABC transporter substrate-binding protein n=1 Tax=Butyrivibrio sp. INlla14 TaxID=1520808 RepID=UPI000876FB1B|nr:ABC transporter substrate-binding protein [Butyrivibrio sp. INlla14]SCY51227.1 putative aldouronate transport system substrate-binding protein [Butyrivibrio sp. INlla14]